VRPEFRKLKGELSGIWIEIERMLLFAEINDPVICGFERKGESRVCQLQ
jgi:hypothetical protein